MRQKTGKLVHTVLVVPSRTASRGEQRTTSRKQRHLLTQLGRRQAQLGVLEGAGALALVLQHLLHALQQLEIVIVTLPTRQRANNAHSRVRTSESSHEPCTAGCAASASGAGVAFFFFFFLSPKPTSWRAR